MSGGLARALARCAMGRGRGRGQREGQVEHKLTGINAVQAVFEQRPNDIIRLYLLESKIPAFSKLLKWCAANKRAYHVVDAAELAKVASSIHHEGVCALVKAKESPSADTLVSMLERRTGPLLVLALDGVANPNNLGAIARSAAHFDAPAIFYRPVDAQVGFSSAMARVAEGGLEHVELVAVPNLSPVLARLKKIGFAIASSSGRADTSLFEVELPARMVLLLGAEDEGVSKELDRLASSRLLIPGSGRVESLNVSAAGAVFLAEHHRQHRSKRS